MAEKEERILIARSTDYILTDTYKGELFEGKIEPHCANVFTRQEAIKHMAKALEEKSEQMAREYLNSDPYNNPWGAEDLAEAALNALLEE